MAHNTTLRLAVISGLLVPLRTYKMFSAFLNGYLFIIFCGCQTVTGSVPALNETVGNCKDFP